jgi:hypothetical protein
MWLKSPHAHSYPNSFHLPIIRNPPSHSKSQDLKTRDLSTPYFCLGSNHNIHSNNKKKSCDLPFKKIK